MTSNGFLWRQVAPDTSIEQGEQPLNREDLIGRGLSEQQANAIQVQRNQQDILQAHLMRWGMVFFCGLCLLIPTGIGLAIWLVSSWWGARRRNETCDAWLIEWTTVVCVLWIYQIFWHRFVLRSVCKYDQEQQQLVGLPPPARVMFYNLCFPVFDFAWKITGICLVATSHTCSTRMPNLYRSILAYASVGIFVTVFMAVNAIGLGTLLAYMLRNGLLTAPTAAPAGTLEAQKIVPFTGEEMGENASCSICLEDYSPEKEIRRTNCGHCFHSKCLSGWLRLNRTCPLCREDLAQPGQQATPTV